MVGKAVAGRRDARPRAQALLEGRAACAPIGPRDRVSALLAVVPAGADANAALATGIDRELPFAPLAAQARAPFGASGEAADQLVAFAIERVRFALEQRGFVGEAEQIAPVSRYLSPHCSRPESLSERRRQ